MLSKKEKGDPEAAHSKFRVTNSYFLSLSAGLIVCARLRAERRRDLEAFAVAALAVQVLVGVLVVDELLGLAVEGQLTARAVRRVAEMRQRRGEMALVDVAGEHFRIVRADRVDEVLVVRILGRGESRRAFVRIRRVGAGPFFVLRPEIRLPLLAGFLDPE